MRDGALSGVCDFSSPLNFIVLLRPGEARSVITADMQEVANSLVRMSTFGMLELTLGDGVYSWRFVNEAGAVLDQGTGTCH